VPNKKLRPLIPMMIGGTSLAWSLISAPISAAGEAPQETAATDLDEVIVTGSRIARPLGEEAGPLIVVTAADIERAAADSIGKILQGLPVQTGATANTSDNFGDGSTRINLRGLGDERTLVLLNGRRFIFGGLGADSSVDLNTIPVSMVDRVEVFGSGASAIYGSDAVAGVVNIITRKSFAGVEAGADYLVAERGDGAIRTAHLLGGRGDERGNVVAGIEYVHQSGVSQGARAYSAHVESLVNPAGPVVRTGSFSTPQGVFLAPGNVLGLPATLLTRVSGSSGSGAADFRPFEAPGDFFDYASYNYLQTPSERTAVWLSGFYKLSATTEVFTEGLAQMRRSRQAGTPSDYSNFRAGGAPVDPATGAQVIPANNYYNPFGVNAIGVFRVLLEGNPLTHEESTQAYRELLGLRGVAGSWHWEGSAIWARNGATRTDTGELLRDELRMAVGPSGLDGAGRVVCGTPDPVTHRVAAGDVIPGCVPLNLFGGLGSDGRGTITPAQIAYISRTLRNTGDNQHWVVDADVTGPLGRLPAGTLDWAMGAQYRRESGALALDPLTGRGVASGFLLQLPAAASFTAREIYAEGHVPLLRDHIAARRVDLHLGVRYSRFSPFGGNTSAQSSVLWKVIPVMALRGTYSQVFRAPSTFESYAAPQVEVRPIGDPCGSGPTPEQQVHCAANGVPGGIYAMQESHGTQVVFGGYPRLTPESGETWTAGVMLTPEALHGAITADFWHVRLDHAVDGPDPQSIADECADTGAAQACGRITRFADGSISQIDARYANLTRLVVEGVDGAVSGSHLLWGGVLTASANATYLRQVSVKRFATGGTAELAGLFQDFTSWPRWRAQVALDWLRGRWRVSYSSVYIDSMRECGDKIFPPDYAYFTPDECRTIDSRVYHDISAAYHFESGLKLSGAIENVFNTHPPRINTSDTANTDPTLYRLLGRTYLLRLVYSRH